jgi:NADP-dependent 3-hydroxy acid dehydrogenase YdfG
MRTATPERNVSDHRRIGPDDRFKMALEPADIARSIVFGLDQAADVQIAEMMILPVNRY